MLKAQEKKRIVKLMKTARLKHYCCERKNSCSGIVPRTCMWHGKYRFTCFINMTCLWRRHYFSLQVFGRFEIRMSRLVWSVSKEQTSAAKVAML